MPRNEPVPTAGDGQHRALGRAPLALAVGRRRARHERLAPEGRRAAREPALAVAGDDVPELAAGVDAKPLDEPAREREGEVQAHDEARLAPRAFDQVAHELRALVAALDAHEPPLARLREPHARARLRERPRPVDRDAGGDAPEARAPPGERRARRVAEAIDGS
jgi:hypothetical protein